MSTTGKRSLRNVAAALAAVGVLGFGAACDDTGGEGDGGTEQEDGGGEQENGDQQDDGGEQDDG